MSCFTSHRAKLTPWPLLICFPRERWFGLCKRIGRLAGLGFTYYIFLALQKICVDSWSRCRGVALYTIAKNHSNHVLFGRFFLSTHALEIHLRKQPRPNQKKHSHQTTEMFRTEFPPEKGGGGEQLRQPQYGCGWLWGAVGAWLLGGWAPT